MTNAEARFSKSLRPRKPEGLLGRTAQDVHLDSHTAPELCGSAPLLDPRSCRYMMYVKPRCSYLNASFSGQHQEHSLTLPRGKGGRGGGGGGGGRRKKLGVGGSTQRHWQGTQSLVYMYKICIRSKRKKGSNECLFILTRTHSMQNC